MYHEQWGDYLNLKDLCVVWGDNISTEVYRDMRFSNGSFTCYYKWPNQEVGSRFNPNQLFNNHLISNDSELNSTIMAVRRGDQVRLKGYLAEYSRMGSSSHRSTSTSCTDSGNGACETIWVEDFEILSRANVFQRALFKISLCTAGLLLAL